MAFAPDWLWFSPRPCWPCSLTHIAPILASGCPRPWLCSTSGSMPMGFTKFPTLAQNHLASSSLCPDWPWFSPLPHHTARLTLPRVGLAPDSAADQIAPPWDSPNSTSRWCLYQSAVPGWNLSQSSLPCLLPITIQNFSSEIYSIFRQGNHISKHFTVIFFSKCWSKFKQFLWCSLV